MKRMFAFVLCLLAPLAFSQQQVTPEDFSNDQAQLFKKITESISTPCCKNAIPVAYHASGMAQEARDQVAGWIREGKSEDAIMAALAELRFGPAKDLKIIFTVPDKGLWGNLVWWIGPIFAGLLLVGIAILVRRSNKTVDSLSDQELVEAYRDYIDLQLKQS